MATSTAPAKTADTKNQLPFPLASALTTRNAFQLSSVSLEQASTVAQTIKIQSFGWITNLLLEVTLTYTAGTTAPTLGPDGLDTVINRVGVRTAGGDNLIQPVDGFTLHMLNTFGGKRFGRAVPTIGTDPDLLPGTNLAMPAASATATNKIYRALQFEVDPSTGLGSIPATASNREFTIDLTFGALTDIFTAGAPAAAAVSVTATAVYWDVPADNGMPFGTTANSQTLAIVQTETPLVSAGDSAAQSSNVGNVIMNHILIFRNASGVRNDTDFSNPFLLEVDNNTRFNSTQGSWKADMANWFGLTNAVDTPGGLRTGVYVIPYRLLAGGNGADANASHAQYLTTLNTTKVVFHGTNYGAAGTLQVTTDSLSSPNYAFVYSK